MKKIIEFWARHEALIGFLMDCIAIVLAICAIERTLPAYVRH